MYLWTIGCTNVFDVRMNSKEEWKDVRMNGDTNGFTNGSRDGWYDWPMDMHVY